MHRAAIPAWGEHLARLDHHGPVARIPVEAVATRAGDPQEGAVGVGSLGGRDAAVTIAVEIAHHERAAAGRVFAAQQKEWMERPVVRAEIQPDLVLRSFSCCLFASQPPSPSLRLCQR